MRCSQKWKWSHLWQDMKRCHDAECCQDSKSYSHFTSFLFVPTIYFYISFQTNFPEFTYSLHFFLQPSSHFFFTPLFQPLPHPTPSLTPPYGVPRLIPSHPILSCHTSPFSVIQPHPVPSIRSVPPPQTIVSFPRLFSLPSPLIAGSPLPHIPISSSPLISAVAVEFISQLKYGQTRWKSARRALYMQDEVAQECQTLSRSDCLN